MSDEDFLIELAQYIKNLTGKLRLKSGPLKPRRLWLKRTALLQNLHTYYQYAGAAVALFEENASEAVEAMQRKDDKENVDRERKALSSLIAFYGHCRVCIKTAQLLAEEGIASAQEKDASSLQKLRDDQADWARNTIEKRNAITAHPHEYRRFIVGVPNVWHSGGVAVFLTIDLDHLTAGKEQFECKLREDSERLRVYLGQLFALLKKSYMEF